MQLPNQSYSSDLGAQVLSVIEVDSGHPNAGADGHNLLGADLVAAWEEIQDLKTQGLLHRAPEERLGDTEDRRSEEISHP
eukprot:Skav227209  [mRNA]  locus=scaffold2048:305222:305688:- [translate_table: standard]